MMMSTTSIGNILIRQAIKSTSQASSFQHRRHLITHISPTISLLRSDTSDNEVYLLGTAHISQASNEEVVDLIQLVKPKYVFVELDANRAAQLRNSNSASKNGNKNMADSFKTLFKGIGKGLPPNIMQQLPPQMNNILPMLQNAPQMMSRMGWLGGQGAEMKAALEEAERIGATCVYGDVDFEVTMRELRLAMMGMVANPMNLMQMIGNAPSPPKELAALTGIVLSGGNPTQIIEAVKTREQAKQMTKYVSEALPPLYDVMITKRDVHMAKMLKKHCSDGTVVAVVGAGHVEGIEREWEALDNS
mmetsp:Transcript_19916/g.31065  ORF Transcript_19916/g.31065 Transcript_19916/m.31065 type:complete len:304 (-) Transcript_19916:45-956(-)|eukprot:CAMPEP_0201732260 /NCGR_PEP_ID=MMETSP0593-20130828/28347_1 /ASSEMBLY_ACC=CAM_ASM_000672 /TAXON_ID=267983 /ORGANISM="Skeletonema japonicum, Strain CCMP2506" /LENGTH=303 /DNA_ID=CAMNT_0048225205 /DNA_START=74 /DNA_END=985 /DNA_ORIENTATION=+